MEYVMAVVHAASDLNYVERLLVENFDFSRRKEGSRRIELTNGAITIFLVDQDGESNTTLRLAFSTGDLQASINSLEAAGFVTSGGPEWVNEWRQEVKLVGPENIQVDLYREYNEDELGIVPDLPKSLDWMEDAEAMTRQLLTSVPISFRESARTKVTKKAEANAIVEGDTIVTLDVACQAIVDMTPDFQYKTLRTEMISNGLNPNDYFK
ncbi:MAG: hypothetical protein OEY09_12985 [Gammaproteobacteria bacterium]|nr:hypothetical protein [Gammaproteobacteria bacterium]